MPKNVIFDNDKSIDGNTIHMYVIQETISRYFLASSVKLLHTKKGRIIVTMKMIVR